MRRLTQSFSIAKGQQLLYTTLTFDSLIMQRRLSGFDLKVPQSHHPCAGSHSLKGCKSQIQQVVRQLAVQVPQSSNLNHVMPYLLKLAISDPQLYWRLGAALIAMVLSKSAGAYVMSATSHPSPYHLACFRFKDPNILSTTGLPMLGAWCATCLGRCEDWQVADEPSLPDKLVCCVQAWLRLYFSSRPLMLWGLETPARQP